MHDDEIAPPSAPCEERLAHHDKLSDVVILESASRIHATVDEKVAADPLARAQTGEALGRRRRQPRPGLESPQILAIEVLEFEAEFKRRGSAPNSKPGLDEIDIDRFVVQKGIQKHIMVADEARHADSGRVEPSKKAENANAAETSIDIIAKGDQTESAVRVVEDVSGQPFRQHAQVSQLAMHVADRADNLVLEQSAGSRPPVGYENAKRPVPQVNLRSRAAARAP
ncbi:MAG: hypothetical protein ABSE69_17325 [Roseiarcus sp.]